MVTLERVRLRLVVSRLIASLKSRRLVEEDHAG
jgi:hypothetical protein